MKLNIQIEKNSLSLGVLSLINFLCMIFGYFNIKLTFSGMLTRMLINDIKIMRKYDI